MSEQQNNGAEEFIEEIVEWWVYRGLYDHKGNLEKGLSHAGFAGRLARFGDSFNKQKLIKQLTEATRECEEFDKREFGDTASTPKLILPADWL